MLKKQHWSFVKTCLEQLAKFKKELDAIEELVGLDSESPILKNAWAAEELMLQSLEKLLGDECETLRYWAYECRYGEHPMGCTIDGVTRTIATLDDVLWLLGYD